MTQKVGCDIGFLVRVLQGKRNLTGKLALKFAEFMKLSKKEKEYFQLLTEFGKAKSQSEKRFFLEKLTGIRKTRIKLIEPAQYEFYDKWYYSAIRELLDVYRFEGDYAQLARLLEPSITPGEAKKAISVLEKLNLIQKNNSGFYESRDTVISAGEDWKAVAIAGYQLSSMDLAKEAYDKFPKKVTNYSTLTLSVSKEAFFNITENLKLFRRQILEMVKHDSNADRVLQMNFQVFPLSKIKNGGKS
jgi:uncharacterized protein (TIGR02147 family)